MTVTDTIEGWLRVRANLQTTLPAARQTIRSTTTAARKVRGALIVTNLAATAIQAGRSLKAFVDSNQQSMQSPAFDDVDYAIQAAASSSSRRSSSGSTGSHASSPSTSSHSSTRASSIPAASKQAGIKASTDAHQAARQQAARSQTAAAGGTTAAAAAAAAAGVSRNGNTTKGQRGATVPPQLQPSVNGSTPAVHTSPAGEQQSTPSPAESKKARPQTML
eukprot:jgi/Chrzof1/5604/Cz16g08250.t1